MTKKSLRLSALLLSLILLAGCGGGAGTAGTDSSGTAGETGSGSTAVYQAQYLPVEGGELTAPLQNGTLSEGELFFTSLGVIADRTPAGVTPDWEEQYWEYGPVLCKVGFDGSARRVDYVPETENSGEKGNSGVLFQQLCAGADGSLWLLENHYRLWNDAPEGMNGNDPEYESYDRSEEKLTLVHLQQDGSILASLPLDGLGSHREELEGAEGSYSFTVNAMAADAEDHVVLAVSEWFGGRSYVEDNRLCVVDGSNGQPVFTIPMQTAPERLAALPDGRIAAAFHSGGRMSVSFVDMKAKTLGEPAALEGTADSLVSDGTGNSLYYGSGNGFYVLDPESGESSRILSWTDCDVARNGSESICVLPDGRIVTTAVRKTAGGEINELVVLTGTDAGSVTEKKILRLAVTNLDPYLSAMVSRYNRSSREYRIEVTDYSQFNNAASDKPEDWVAGITRLQTEIITGNGPDILDVSLLSVDRLGATGLLEDLYPWLDSDPDLGRDALLGHVLEAFEENGKLYQTVSNFYVLTAMGMSDVVGGRMGWTMEQFDAAMKMLQTENPDSTAFDQYMTRDDAMLNLLYLELENFVDWDSGECRFDSDAFLRFLEFVKSFPVTMDPGDDELSLTDFDPDTRLRMHLQLLKPCSFTRFEDVQQNTVGLSGEKGTFAGYPTETGVGSMFAQLGSSLAMSSGCADKEAAWQFLRLFFLPDYQEYIRAGSFPTNRTVYEEMKQEAVTVQYKRNPDGSFTLNDRGERVEADRGSTEVSGMKYSFRTVTEEECALLEEIIKATTRVLRTDESLKEIVTSGAAPYFADQRSAEEVAKLIQSKASIYVNEQK